jgi:hypothetical protein
MSSAGRESLGQLRQKEIMALQDEMLEDLGRGIDRIARQARSIGDETSLQVKLLDTMDKDVERTSAALEEETRHAARVKEGAQVGRLWCALLVQIVIIVLLVIFIFFR